MVHLFCIMGHAGVGLACVGCLQSEIMQRLACVLVGYWGSQLRLPSD